MRKHIAEDLPHKIAKQYTLEKPGHTPGSPSDSLSGSFRMSSPDSTAINVTTICGRAYMCSVAIQCCYIQDLNNVPSSSKHLKFSQSKSLCELMDCF